MKALPNEQELALIQNTKSEKQVNDISEIFLIEIYQKIPDFESRLKIINFILSYEEKMSHLNFVNQVFLLLLNY